MEECDICGGCCDGVHSVKTNNEEKLITQMVNVLSSYDPLVVDEIIRRINIKRINANK